MLWTYLAIAAAILVLINVVVVVALALASRPGHPEDDEEYGPRPDDRV